MLIVIVIWISKPLAVNLSYDLHGWCITLTGNSICEKINIICKMLIKNIMIKCLKQ